MRFAAGLPGWRGHAWDALRSLHAFRLRTLLALLGVAIGTAALVALVNIARNAAAESLRGFVHMGSDIVVAQFPWSPEVQAPMHARLDTDAMLRRVPELASVFFLSVSQIHHARDDVDINISVAGVCGDFTGVLGISLAEGRLLSRFDGETTFAVAGGNVPRLLAGSLGQPLRLGNWVSMGAYRYQVIGMIEAKPANPLLPVDFSSALIIPLESMRRLVPQTEITHVVARIRSDVSPDQAAASLGAYLRQLLPERQVELLVPHLLLETQRRQGRLLTWLLAGLGGIVLLVGGVGIMNVMLISVTERQREIGLRLALGAQQQDIRILFLMEAAALSVFGALAGCVLGVAAAWVYANFSGWQFVLQWRALPLGVSCALLTGIFFGGYPAIRAARLTPAFAMRKEY